LEFPANEKIITAGIGVGVFLLITTYFLAFVLFGRLTEYILLLLAIEILVTLLFSAIFLKRRYLWTTLARPVAAGVLLSILVTVIVIVIGTTMIHAPLPPPDSHAVSSGRSVLMMAVPTDEITTSSPEAKELLIKGLTAASRNNGFEEAIRHYDQALALDPDFTTAWMAKGVALHNIGSHEEAIGCIDRAIALEPENAGALSLKGIMLASSGHPEEAAECYTRASEINPIYQGPPPGAALPTTAPFLNGTYDSNVSKTGSSERDSPYPPSDLPTIYFDSLEEVRHSLGVYLSIPTCLPEGYSYRGGYLTAADGIAVLFISNDTVTLRLIQGSWYERVEGVLSGTSSPVSSGEIRGTCTENGTMHQLHWTERVWKRQFYLIGELPCQEFVRMAESLAPLTNETLESVNWSEPIPSIPLPGPLKI
jgi:FOG: TPR repeat